MTTHQLDFILKRMGVVRIGSQMMARCPHCDHPDSEPEDWHLRVGIGSSYPLLLFCYKCCVAKPQTEEDREQNRLVGRDALAEAGVDPTITYDRMDSGQIRRLWASVTVNGWTPTTEETERADDDVLHHCYSSLLSSLTLSDRHRRWLTKKGLDADWCFNWGYRTAPSNAEAASIVTQFAKQWGHLSGVPGLTRDRWLTREGGLLIPCRDQYERVGSVKMRMTDGRTRMRLLGGGGTKAKQMVHWSAGSKAEDVLWVCEGERKADVVRWRLGANAVGIPGVGSWSLLPAFTVPIIVAMDNDEAGRKCEGRILRSVGRATVARWTGAKGVDDALVNGKEIRLEEVTVQTEGKQLPSSPTQFTKGQRLRDRDIIDYIRQFGSVLRHEMTCWDGTVDKLIRAGQIKMRKTRDGQVLEATT